MIIVENLAKDESKFDYSDHFLDEITANAIQNTLKEAFVIDQLVCKTKYMLESLPYCVILFDLILCIEFHLLFEHLIKLFWVPPVLPQCVDLNISFFGAAIA